VVQVSHRFAVASAVFDDEHLVSYAGLVAVMTLAEQTGFRGCSVRRSTSPSRGSSQGRPTRPRSW
jgi:hypothetical protein